MIDKKTIWSDAGMPGLILGLVPAVTLTVGSFSGSTILSLLLWCIKFSSCIYLMYFFMRKFSSLHEEADNSDTFRFGAVVALLSAFVYSSYYLIYVLYIQPDIFKDSIQVAMDNLGSYMDSNSRDQIENMLPKLPTVTFFFNLCYCFLFGTVLSAILSRMVPSSNPFSDDEDSF